jgi:hypothetical protein
MHIRKDMLACAIALTFATGGTAVAAQQYGHAQPLMQHSQQRATTGQATSSAVQLSLTAQQKQQLFQAAQSLPAQNFGNGAMPAAGSKLPSGIKLSAIPSSAKQKLGSAVQSSEMAKLQNGDVILANPKSKMVQAVITPADANSTTGQGAANGLTTTPNPSSSKMRK